MHFHVRRDSDRRSQLIANLDDLIQFFDVLDSVDKIPPIHCEASDLLSFTGSCLKNLGGLVERLENKLSSLLDSITSTQHSYVTVASSVPPSQVTSPSSISAQKSTTSRTTTSHVREVNLYPKRVTFLSPKR